MNNLLHVHGSGTSSDSISRFDARALIWFPFAELTTTSKICTPRIVIRTFISTQQMCHIVVVGNDIFAIHKRVGKNVVDDIFEIQIFKVGNDIFGNLR